MVLGYKRNPTLKDREKSFLSLINDNNEKLYKIAYSYVKNKDDALDIIQEAVYKAYISYHKVKKPEYEKTWITRIVINTAIDFLKKNKKVVFIDKSFIENTGDSGIEHIDDKLAVEHILENLNERERAVIILRYFEDITLDEIGEILDAPLSTIKTILYRTLKKIKLNLKEVNVDEK